jgi:arylsulfatase A-like enzyme
MPGEPSGMNRRDALKQLAAALLAAAGGGCAAQGSPLAHRPNILFIMTDDHAQSALGCYGNGILPTPNLDRIGAEGMRFVKAFVTNSLCAPSRATFLTGLYSHTHGIMTNGEESGFYDEPPLDNSLTWPNLLRSAGFYTGIVGKWHLSNPPTGYDVAAVLPGQGRYFDPELIVNGSAQQFAGHTDDVITERALDFLRTRPRRQPFCLLYHFKAPHRGWEPAPRFASAFEDIEIPAPPTFADDFADRPLALRKSNLSLADMPDYRGRGVSPTLPDEERARRNFQHFIKDYYRVLLGVDENVGRVLDELDRQHIADNTLVIYTSDNGFFLGEHGLFDKRLMHEPSITVPMLLRHPAEIAPGQVDDEHMVLNIDLAPTVLDAAGKAPPGAVQGASWMPLLRRERVSWRKDFLYEYFEFPAAHCVRRHRGVRDARWKLIHWEVPDEWELYDLQSDPRERVNLAGRPEYADQQRRLAGRLAALRRQYGDVDPPGYVPREPDNLKGCAPLG